jgi:P-type Ca2+ transporter type 2C
MSRPPRKPDAAIFDRPAIVHVGWMGMFICAASLLLAGAWNRFGWGRGEWQTVLFSAIGFAQIGQAWGLRALTGRPSASAATPRSASSTSPPSPAAHAPTLVLQLGVIYVPALARAFPARTCPSPPPASPPPPASAPSPSSSSTSNAAA